MSIITISRGSLKISQIISEQISERLGCPIVTREDVIRKAEEYGVKETGLGELSFVERSPSFWDKMSDRKKQYLMCIQTALYDYALKGCFVYHGHLAQFLIEDIPFLLRVRLTVPYEKRITTLMLETDKSREEAEHHIKIVDERRHKWSHFLYGVDWKDTSHYDMILNLEKMSVELAVDLIIKSVGSAEFELSPQSGEILKNLHLASLARVNLQQSPRTRGSEVEIVASSVEKKLFITGLCPDIGAEMWEEDIRNELGKMDGVTEIIINRITENIDYE